MQDPRFVDAGGIRTRYFEAGQGEPVVLVHGAQFGYLSTALDWEPSFDLLARYFHVYAFDKIGQGDSDNPKSDSQYVIGTTVWHTLEFIRAVGIDSAHLVGHSRGGYTVCRLALEHPEVARSVVSVDSGTLMPTSPQDWYAKRDRKAATITDSRERVRFIKEANSYSYDHITDRWLDDTLRVLRSAKFKEAAEAEVRLNKQFMEDMAEVVEETCRWIMEGKLRSPTLVMWGYNDPSAKWDPAGKDTLDLILPNVEHSEYVVLNRAGHYGFREQADAFTAAVKGFIKSIQAPEPSPVIPK